MKHAEALIAGTLPSPRQLRPEAEPVVPEREAPPASENHPPIRRIRLAAHPQPKPEIPMPRTQSVRGRAVPAPMPAMVPASESISPVPPVSLAKLTQQSAEPSSPAGADAWVAPDLPPLTMVPPEPVMPAEPTEIPRQSSVVVPSPSQRPSLDIRPRTLDANAPLLVPQAELPRDLSGLPPEPGHVTYLPARTTDIRPIDVCASTRFYHKPLYFEDKYLERYGQAPGVLRNADGLRSTVHFFWSTGTLPLHMWHVYPWECVPTDCLMRAHCNCTH